MVFPRTTVLVWITALTGLLSCLPVAGGEPAAPVETPSEPAAYPDLGGYSNEWTASYIYQDDNELETEVNIFTMGFTLLSNPVRFLPSLPNELAADYERIDRRCLKMGLAEYPDPLGVKELRAQALMRLYNSRDSALNLDFGLGVFDETDTYEAFVRLGGFTNNLPSETSAVSLEYRMNEDAGKYNGAVTFGIEQLHYDTAYRSAITTDFRFGFPFHEEVPLISFGVGVIAYPSNCLAFETSFRFALENIPSQGVLIATYVKTALRFSGQRLFFMIAVEPRLSAGEDFLRLDAQLGCRF